MIGKLRLPLACTMAVATAAAALLTACDSGSGGTRRVYFSMSNYEGCVTAYVYFNLLTPDAEPARTQGGSPDCTLSPELAGAGCTLTFEEVQSGNLLRAAVGGCHVPTLVNLFSCEYVKVDLGELNTDAGASCGCLSHESSCYINGICDLCAGSQGDRKGCENCTNNLDDDGDHRVDCDDSDCELTEECGFGRTTVSCTYTTTTSVTSTSQPLQFMTPNAPKQPRASRERPRKPVSPDLRQGLPH